MNGSISPLFNLDIKSHFHQAMCEAVGLVGARYITLKDPQTGMELRIPVALMPFVQPGDQIKLDLICTRIAVTPIEASPVLLGGPVAKPN